MPTSEAILVELKTIANDWQLLSALWHAYFAALILALILRFRPTKRAAGLALALPVLSVSILAWVYANFFNGAIFALLGIVLIAVGARLGCEAVEIAPPWLTVVGALMLGFGWTYPHFLENATAIDYLYAAPAALIPCPTLSIVIGFTLILGGFRSRLWCLVVAMAGIFYGAYGAARLGVTIDWVLFVGALITTYAAFSRQLMAADDKASTR